MELQDNNVVLTKEEGKALNNIYYNILLYASPCAAVNCGGRYPCTDCPFKIMQDAYHKYVGALGKLLPEAEVEIR